MFPFRYQRLKCVHETAPLGAHIFEGCTHPRARWHVKCHRHAATLYMGPARVVPGQVKKKRDYPKVAPGSWLSPVAVKVIDSVGVGRYVSVVLDVLQRVLNVEEQEGSDTE